MRTASTLSVTPAALFSEISTRSRGSERLRRVPPAVVAAAPARPIDARRWVDVSLIPAAAGVWLYVLATIASQL